MPALAAADLPTFKIRAVNGDFWCVDNGDGNPIDIVYQSIRHAMADCIVFVREARGEGLAYGVEDLEIVEFDAQGKDVALIQSPDFPTLQHLEILGVSDEGKEMIWNDVTKDIEEV